MTAKPTQRVRGEEGAAAVEFAIVVTLLFTLIFGIMEFGLAFFELQNLRSAAREGARSAAVGGVRSEVRAALTDGSSGSLPSSYDSFAIEVNGSTWSNTSEPACDTETQGDEVVVDVDPGNNPALLPAGVQSAFVIEIPFIPSISLTPTIAGSFRCE